MREINKDIYIHIGYPKTGTTTLQCGLFRLLSENDYVTLIGQPYTRIDPKMQRIIHILTDCETLEFESQYKREVEDYFYNVIGKKILISEESFSTGSSLSGRVDRFCILKRLYKLFPNAKIIIVIREQKDIIKSVYLQKLKIDKHFRLSFKEWLELNKNKIYMENIFQYFDYYNLISIYARYFGKKNVYVLLFEEFLEDNIEFYKKILNILQINLSENELKFVKSIHKNKTLTTADLYLRKLSFLVSLGQKILPNNIVIFLKKNLKNKGKKIQLQIPEEFISFINNMYKFSNQRLALEYNLNLKKYKYPL